MIKKDFDSTNQMLMNEEISHSIKKKIHYACLTQIKAILIQTEREEHI